MNPKILDFTRQAIKEGLDKLPKEFIIGIIQKQI